MPSCSGEEEVAYNAKAGAEIGSLEFDAWVSERRKRVGNMNLFFLRFYKALGERRVWIPGTWS